MTGVEHRDTQALASYLFQVNAPEWVYDAFSGLRARVAELEQQLADARQAALSEGIAREVAEDKLASLEEAEPA